MKTSHLYQQDNNAAYTSIFLKRCKGTMELAQKRKVQAESVKIQTQTQKIPKGLSVLNDCGINYDEPLSPMEIASNRQERIQREKQKTQPTGVSLSFETNIFILAFENCDFSTYLCYLLFNIQIILDIL